MWGHLGLLDSHTLSPPLNWVSHSLQLGRTSSLLAEEFPTRLFLPGLNIRRSKRCGGDFGDSALRSDEVSDTKSVSTARVWLASSSTLKSSTPSNFCQIITEANDENWSGLGFNRGTRIDEQQKAVQNDRLTLTTRLLLITSTARSGSRSSVAVLSPERSPAIAVETGRYLNEYVNYPKRRGFALISNTQT